MSEVTKIAEELLATLHQRATDLKASGLSDMETVAVVMSAITMAGGAGCGSKKVSMQ